MHFRVESYESITSTNDRIKQAIEAGEPEGLAVRSLRQTAGYGRQGRAWESPLGGMYQSFLLRPRVPLAQLPTLSLLVGLAVRRAVAGLLPGLADRLQVKWPNDLVVAPAGGAGASGLRSALRVAGDPAPHVPAADAVQVAGAAAPHAAAGDAPHTAAAPHSAPALLPFLKLGGISSELHAKALCVGVGINVARPEQLRPAAGKNIPVFLDELGFAEGPVEARIEAVADALCAQLAELYPRWCAEGFAPFARELDECSALTGRFVSMEDIEGNPLSVGKVTGIAPDGRLILQTADGGEVLVASGEAHIRA